MEQINKQSFIASLVFEKLEDIKDSLTAKETPDWDSMNYLLFVAELEKQFNVSFTMDDVLNAKSLGDIKNMLRLRGVKI